MGIARRTEGKGNCRQRVGCCYFRIRAQGPERVMKVFVCTPRVGQTKASLRAWALRVKPCKNDPARACNRSLQSELEGY